MLPSHSVRMTPLKWPSNTDILNWNMVLAGGGLVASDEITVAIDLELTKPVEAMATSHMGERLKRELSAHNLSHSSGVEHTE